MKPEALCGPSFSHMDSNTLPAFCFFFFFRDWLTPGPLPPGLHCHPLSLGDFPSHLPLGSQDHWDRLPRVSKARVQGLLTWDICTRAFGSLGGEEKEKGG